jgi:hemerythrin-like domain-containing protein
MNAMRFLRRMHADTRLQFKLILGAAEPVAAVRAWHALLPTLDLHEQIEDEFVYAPLREELGTGTPLGDWDVVHEAEVQAVKQLIQYVGELEPGTPVWQMGVATVFERLSKHVMTEENSVFGRIEQLWGAERLERVGTAMEEAVTKATSPHSRRTRKAVAA